MRNNPPGNQPTDGGYGWVILACCAICFSSVMGLLTITGLVVVEIIALYDVTRAQAFLVLVLCKLSGMISAPVVGKMFSKFDCNVILCTGSLLISLSFILTACTTAYWQILITYGCIQGVGLSCILSSSPLTVGLYFKQRRSMAMGILYTIAGINSFAFPMLFNWLLDMYSFSGALLILGGITLNSCAFGMLVRQPSLMHSRMKCDPPVMPEETRKFISKDGQNPVASSKCSDVIHSKTAVENHQLHRPNKQSYVKSAMIEIGRDLRLFRDGHFVLQLVTRSSAMLVHLYIWSILPDFAENEMYILKSQVAFIISMSSIGETAVRFATGMFLDVFPWPKKYSFAGSALLMGATAFTLQFLQTQTQLITGSVILGLWTGMHIVTVTLVEIELMGPQRVHVANGLSRFMAGVVSVIGGMIIGHLRDVLGSYNACLSFVGGSAMLGGLVWIFEPLVLKCCPLQDHKQTTTSKPSC